FLPSPSIPSTPWNLQFNSFQVKWHHESRAPHNGLSALREDLNEMHQSLGRFLQPATRIEFQFAMELVPAREQVGAGKAAKGQLGTVRAAANRLRERRDAGAARGLEGVVHQLGMVLQYFFHVLVVLFHVDRNAEARKLPFGRRGEIAEEPL